MFDNINQGNAKSNQGGGGSMPRSNSERTVNYPGSQEEVTDMFADIEPPARPDIFKPKQTVEMTGGAQGNLPTEVIDEGGVGKKVFTLLVVIIGLALLLGGGYYGYKFYKNRIVASSEENLPVDTTPTRTETNTTEPLGIDVDTTANQAQPETDTSGALETGLTEGAQATTSTGTEPNGTTPAANTFDTDQDGLTDSEEEALGTSLTNVDTDGDGLSDREEVNVYKTNPLNPDTDGDGYSDGAEVNNGYNPNGQGKLYDINKSL